MVNQSRYNETTNVRRGIMRYEIIGGSFPAVVCYLNDGEQMISESGAMSWMSPNMKMETKGGGIGKIFTRMFTGESLFINVYTAQGDGMIAFSSSFPGKIMPVEISPEKGLIVQKSAFLASEAGVELSIFFQRRIMTGIFGGEGFIMQRLSGQGTAFIEIDGDLVEYELKPQEKLIIDTGSVAAFEPTVHMDIEQVSGIKNKLFGGEGFFHTVLTGPGKIWLQTMPMNRLLQLFAPLT